jgi:hypothetical protein
MVPVVCEQGIRAFCRWLENRDCFAKFIKQFTQVAGGLEAGLFVGRCVAACLNNLVVEQFFCLQVKVQTVLNQPQFQDEEFEAVDGCFPTVFCSAHELSKSQG